MLQIEKIRTQMSPDEIHDANKTAAEAAIDLAQLESEKKEFNSKISARIASLKKLTLDKANQAKTGLKEESVEVWVDFDADNETAYFYPNQKMEGDPIGERPMLPEELKNPTLWGGSPDDED